MNCIPLLSSGNRYALLDVYSVEENSTLPSDPTTESMIAPDVQPTSSHITYPPHLKRWERRLPCKYVVASTPLDNSLHLKVKIVTADTQEVKSVNALVDCRATGPFMDRDYVVQNKITTRNLS